jgi:hypothetical protein
MMRKKRWDFLELGDVFLKQVLLGLEQCIIRRVFWSSHPTCLYITLSYGFLFTYDLSIVLVTKS